LSASEDTGFPPAPRKEAAQWWAANGSKILAALLVLKLPCPKRNRSRTGKGANRQVNTIPRLAAAEVCK
jgi:hypothetical protein